MADVKKEAKKKPDTDPKKKPKKKEPPPPPTPEELRTHAQLQIEGAALAVDFRDRANYYRRAAEILQSIPEDPESAALAKDYLKKAEEVVDNGYRDAYAQATAAMEQASHAEEYYKASTALRRIQEYRDAGKLAEECERRYERLSHRGGFRLFVGLFILALLAAAVVTAQTSFGKYQLGRVYLATSHYSGAMNQFKRLGDYRDSEQMAQESRYRLAVEHMAHKRYDKAADHFQKLGDYKDSQEQQVLAERELLRNAAVGDTIQFAGEKWLVLDLDGSELLLLRKKQVGDRLPYNRTPEPVRWTDSSLCLWLNTIYLSRTFSPEEQALLVPDTAELAENPVFLLSADEAEAYAERITHIGDNWWLRDTGEAEGTAAFTTPEGQVIRYGCPVDSAAIRIRPAIRVNCPNS